MRVRTVLVVLIAFVLVGAACGDDGSGSTAETDGDHAEGDENPEVLDFGAPADAADADLVIEIVARDDLTFTPDAVEVAAGEIVTFRIVNEGETAHDFTLGDSGAQDTHETEMQEMRESGMEHEPDSNAIVLEPGEIGELTWHFTAAGSILFGCHQPGHYAGGMVGNLEIAS